MTMSEGEISRKIGELGLTADEMFEGLARVEKKFNRILEELSECEQTEELVSKIEVCRNRFEANKLRPRPPKPPKPMTADEKNKIVRIKNSPGEVSGGAPGLGKRG